jgi:hypothetical protein
LIELIEDSEFEFTLAYESADKIYNVVAVLVVFGSYPNKDKQNQVQFGP